jgi:hypothetical protein
MRGEATQCIIESHQLIGRGIVVLDIDEGNPATTAAVPPRRLAARIVDQDETHGFGGSGKEVTAARELSIANQPQVCLMNQTGGLQRLPRFLLRQLLAGELAQLVIDQRQELLSGLKVALLDGGQDTGDVGHSSKHTARVLPSQHAGG